MIINKKIFILLLSTGLWSACVESFDIKTKNSLQVIVVDALITDEAIQQKVRIQQSIDRKGLAVNEEIPNLKVELIVNGKENIALNSQGKGIYLLPESFRAKAGNVYKLVFQKPDGTKYASNEQIMFKNTAINKVYDEFVLDGITKGITKIPTNNLYVDFQDAENEQNFYTWTWTLWERQFVCFTDFNVDYYCNQNCWEILKNDNVNIYSDIYSNR